MDTRKAAASGKRKVRWKKGPPVSTVLAALSEEYAPFPWEPRYDAITEVTYTILSQHTSDVNSERAFARLMKEFGTLEAVAEGAVELIAESIKIGGLAKIKAPRIKEVLNLIIERCGTLDLEFLKEMPLQEAKKWLRELPGIGPKSAGIILCFSLGMPAMAVDTHIHRVIKRVGLVAPNMDVEKSQELLEAMVEPQDIYPLHVALITHGRQVCKAPRPLCQKCVLGEQCPSRSTFEKQEAQRAKARASAALRRKNAPKKARA